MGTKAKSLQKQAVDYANEIHTPGVSRYEYKKENGKQYPLISSDETKKGYTRHWVTFAKWVNGHTSHKCKTLDCARQYVDIYMQDYAKSHAQSSCAAARSALAKLYNTTGPELVKQAYHRPRSAIKNNRGGLRTRWERNHKDACDFARFTGLRRSELLSVRAVDYRGNGVFELRKTDKKVQTKGGRPRNIQVLPQNIERIEAIIRERAALHGENSSLFQPKDVPKDAQTHQYRSLFATEYYNHHARPLEELTAKKIYYCRGDRKGEKFDKRAMLITTRQLGHNRIDVIARSYLRV